MSLLGLDHPYARHWSEHFLTNTSHVLPLKQLLHLHEDDIDYCKLERRQNKNANDLSSSDEEVDVETLTDTHHTIGSVSWHCAEQKARMQMNECERHVASNIKAGSIPGEDRECFWEENIVKHHWSDTAKKLFNQTVKILQDEKLARLAYKGAANEIVQRRLSVDRSASRLRSALANVDWQVKMTQWLHALLIENLPTTLLAYYLDIMQTLRSKVPTLIERMIMPTRDSGSASTERLSILLKRPWDPAVTAVVSNMKQKMNQSVLFIVVQCSASQSSMPVTSRRLRFWNSLLSQIGKVVQVASTSDDGDGSRDKSNPTVEELADDMLSTICKKVHEISARHPQRKIVLVGWHVTSLFNCHVALLEEVAAVICLGFPIYTIFGQRGEIDDVLCDVTTPTLFVIGDQTVYCGVEDLEDAREKTFTEAITSSVVIHGADDWLRVSENRKRRCAATQSMIDRQILECICDFLQTVFLPPGEREDHLLEVGTASLKRPHSFSDLHNHSVKRQRSSSPQSLMRKSNTSAQLSQLFSHQRESSEEGGDAKLRGLSFNLQTGSVSGLTSLPGSVNSGRQRSSFNFSSRSMRVASVSRKSSTDSTSAQSRSITIDLTKDPNAQLSSALSKRKSQLLQPTESQTQAAVAAILDNDFQKSADVDSTISQPTPSHLCAASSSSHTTAIMSPSSNFEKFVASISSQSDAKETVHTTATSTATSSPILDPTPTLAFSKGIGTFSSQVAAAAAEAKKIAQKRSFKPLREFSTIDQSSIVFSRTHKEERETQQATAILEQLTSGLDSGTSSPTASPSTSPDSYRVDQTRGSRTIGGFSARKNSVCRKSHDGPPSDGRYAQGASTARGRGSKVRTRVGKSAPRNDDGLTRTTAAPGKRYATSLKTEGKSSVVRYVLTSSGLTGVLASRRGGARRFTLIPEQGAGSRPPAQTSPTKSSSLSKIFSPGSKRTLNSSPGAIRKIVPSSTESKESVTGSSALHADKVSHSSTPFVDMILGAAKNLGVQPHSTPKKPTVVTHSQKTITRSVVPTTSPVGKVISPAMLQQQMKTPLLKTSSGKSVVYIREKASPPSAGLPKNQPVVKSSKTGIIQSGKTLTRVITNKSGERTLLSITRPRSVSAGSPNAPKTSVVSRTVSDATEDKTATVRLPSVVISKLKREATVTTKHSQTSSS
ncbi:uncharacterized protein LOC143460302 isoform X1 [Clavelina lepadiformis]|uniref:uncharacterized protein LOC143460302 isoform X1 n=1 Tax=Clavelina lepadiformis TaxID=159417 RepID=UPI0040430F4B